MKITRLVALIIVFLITGTCLFAQSNEIIDTILSHRELTCGNGAYLVLAAAGLIDETATPEQAMTFLKEKKWIKDSLNSGDRMLLGQYSAVIMKSFNMKGGLFYSIFRSPRYASRELGYLGYISKDSGAYRSLSGSEAISIIGNLLRDREE